jgi:hypothetical protein
MVADTVPHELLAANPPGAAYLPHRGTLRKAAISGDRPRYFLSQLKGIVSGKI